MIKSITVENFTVIGEKSTLKFAKGINVVIGENGVGKSHMLKLAYALVAVSHEASREKPNKEMFQKMVARKLMALFRPDALGRLVHRAQGTKKCHIAIRFHSKSHDFDFEFSTRSKTDGALMKNETKVPASSRWTSAFKAIVSLYGL